MNDINNVNNKKKILIINTLVLILCVAVVSLFSFIPTNRTEVLEKYMVSFDPKSGGEVHAIEIEEGGAISEPEAPTRDGYVFIGWMLGDELYDFSQKVSGDITLEAAWQELEPDKVYYTVTFFTDGGTTFANQVLESGQLVVKPEDPVKEGFTFNGWQINGVNYDFNQPVTSDITISAVWVENPEEEEPEENPDDNKDKEPEKFTVKFDGNGGTLGGNCGNQTIEEGNKARNVCSASRSGYTLVGFNTSKSATSSNISTKKITSNTTFYAIWKKNIVYYSVKFNLNGGSLGGTCNNLRIESGTSLTSSQLNVCKPTKKYYTLSGWTNSSGGNAVGTRVNGDMTVSAKWTKQSFKVTCSQTGGLAGQECLLSVSGVSNSAISKIEFSYRGQWVPAGTYSGGYKMNNSLFKNVSEFRITIDNETYNGSK